MFFSFTFSYRSTLLVFFSFFEFSGFIFLLFLFSFAVSSLLFLSCFGDLFIRF